jgi:hypothetical protein
MNWIRDFALILLAAEAFFVALVPLVLCGGLVYGLWWLQRHENLPTWLQLARAYLSLARSYVELAMCIVVQPILRVHTALATVQGWLEGVTKFVKGGNR